MGKGVLTAVKNVNEIIAPSLIGMDPTKQVHACCSQHWCQHAAVRLPLPFTEASLFGAVDTACRTGVCRRRSIAR